MKLTVGDIVRVYSGELGCMCGCIGTYADTKRAKKRALDRILKTDYRLQLWGGDDTTMGCLLHQTKTRNNAVYLRLGTKLPQEVLDHLVGE